MVIAFRHHVKIAAFLAKEGRRADKAAFGVHSVNIINSLLRNYFFSMALWAYIFDAILVFHLAERFQDVS
mgnify:CR=1 FL=1